MAASNSGRIRVVAKKWQPPRRTPSRPDGGVMGWYIVIGHRERDNDKTAILDTVFAIVGVGVSTIGQILYQNNNIDKYVVIEQRETTIAFN